tara:strand:- start:2015 stop:4177 length:2163 start_codon:yes stop_codon:yes gene_type:complete
MTKIYNLQIDEKFLNFVNNDILEDLKIQKNYFWEECSKLINELNPLNKKLLEKRISLQEKINDWHNEHAREEFNKDKYKKFLFEIGYIVKEGFDFKIDTKNVDLEISNISGPQLVVPITNARYALNAVNARWGSLYDAIYGTDVLGSLPSSNVYDQNRGKKVIEYSKNYLNKILPLKQGTWQEVESFKFENNELYFLLSNQIHTQLNENKKAIGYKVNLENKIEELIFLVNNLHIRILINENNQIGKNDKANISDIILESAISTILDCEDSVATVDPEDKILAYRNWLGLMKGNLNTKFSKDGKIIHRSINKDIEYFTYDGIKKNLKSQSLMLVRNVGLLMTSSAILDKEGKEVGEGLMDALITATIALYDLRKKGDNKNSQENSIYIVKPKMHGPEEVSFTSNLMDKIEKILNIPKFTIKIGIMDEERRTSINLKECIRAAKSRVAFINTGFLDRTGDEIHTSMFAGPFLKKVEMKNATWINAYEKRNVEIGLECGLQGKAQIGKGMWAMPDLMNEMLKQKISHPLSGANCAWVPSPTAATLHAMHYHELDVKNIQNNILKQKEKNSLSDLLSLPLLNRKNLSEQEIVFEIENNVQGILGYVVKWIDQGIGCSKVLDINNVGLMEDRATCRISSQALANWLHHNIITEDQVMNALKKMATVVDEQNKNDTNYIPMSKTFNTFAFNAAKDLIFNGKNQPSGYTEPILHKKRLEFKSKKIN